MRERKLDVMGFILIWVSLTTATVIAVEIINAVIEALSS